MSSLILRDWALASSGLIDLRIGGRPVYPYQPDAIWEALAITKERDFTYPASTGRDLHRRSLYTFWRRTIAPANMFDASARQVCKVRPSVTNTALHALTTLNDPGFVEAARALGARIMKEGGADPATRATYGFRLCLSRHPTPPELGRLLAFYRQELDRYSKDPKAAVAAAGGPGAKVASSAPVSMGSADAEAAAWTMVSNVLLNLDETITKE